MTTEAETVKPEIGEMKANLTKRNLQYVQEVEKHLRETGQYGEEQQANLIYEMVEKVLENQKQGVTARKLFDVTPTEYVKALTVKAAPVGETAGKWWIALDGGLLVLGAMMLISGVSAIFQGQTLGLAVLFVTFLVGGGAMMVLRKYAGAMRQGEKGGTWKYLLIAMVVILVWMTIMTVVQVVVPAKWNIALEPYPTVIVGVALLALRFYLKRKKNIPNL
ncbi:DUF1129 domain-containing protein [Paenilisteria newyorkensis]|uniref:DUF1129 domain-containing protein n=1 Tax=Listeria newyorkensis TaxID=1497681 RepID=UPI000669C481|nr:DUF1129 family protein [Listeria newyorkensis]KMT61948.1 hypothetical protein X559_1721 [Listeria newyorkensis]